MSVAAAKRETLIDKRAHALALVLLTRRPQLVVEEETRDRDFGFDYIVRFRTPHKEGLREFAIQLKGVRGALTKEQADKAARPALQQFKRHGPCLRPVCLFLFTMANDAAWHTWAAEPQLSPNGRALLRLHDQPDCRPLDDSALDTVLQRVHAWYDAVFPSVIINGPADTKADRQQANR